MLLNVYYKIRRDEAGHIIWQDEEIESLVGATAIASGIFLPNNERDMQFELTESEAVLARVKLAEHGYRYSEATQ